MRMCFDDTHACDKKENEWKAAVCGIEYNHTLTWAHTQETHDHQLSRL